MASRIPNVVILPEAQSKKLYGIDPVIITRDDMVSITGWYKLAVNHDMFLDEKEFKNRDLFVKYWLISMGMVKYPFMLFYGQEGSGKSMGMAVTTHRLVAHFDRRVVLDFTPPNGEYYRPGIPVIKRQIQIQQLAKMGDPQNLIPRLEAEIVEIQKTPPFQNFYDEEFTKDIQEQIDRLQRLEKELALKGQEPSEEEYKKVRIYNAVFGLDEGDSYGDVQSQTNLIGLIGRIARRRRHFHTTILMAYVDIDDVPKRQILNRMTHHVMCQENWVYEGYCSLRVKDVRPGGSGETKFMHLKPDECSHLWNSHAAVAISHDIDIHFGNAAAKKKKDNQEKAVAKEAESRVATKEDN